jgi:outer membrane protein TolC
MKLVINTLTLTLLMACHGLHAQPVSSLEQYMQAVQAQAWQAKMATAEQQRAEAAYRLFRTGLRPQVALQAFLPDFTRTSSSVVQPNGSISFRPLFQSNASLALSVQQAVPFTGGTFFAETLLDRFDDFGQKATLYNGIPLRIGYRQSLVGFNSWKWDMKLEQKMLALSKAQYRQEVATMLQEATRLYFDALLARANLAIADSNRQVNEKLLVLAEERLALGKISEDEKLQMEAEYKQSVVQVAQAKSLWHQATLAMRNMLPRRQPIAPSLVTPAVFTLSLPAAEALQALAKAHAPAIQQTALQAEVQRRNAAQTKAELSPTLELFTTLGVAKNGEKLSDVYRQPFMEQQIRVGIGVPLVDWGRKKAAVQQAQHRIERAEAEAGLQADMIEHQVQQLYTQLHELQERLQAQRYLIDISEKRYRISTERYTAGAVLLTELVLAQRQKDQAIRDYLLSLQEYYGAWHTLNSITGGKLPPLQQQG